MFGWELPPYNSGGLGTACLGMTEGLVPLGVEVDFVIPHVFGDFPFSHMRVLSASSYSTTEEVEKLLSLNGLEQTLISQSLGYGNRLEIDEKRRISITHLHGRLPVSPNAQAAWYAYQAAAIAAQKTDFNVIHCHDWMTYYCGMAAREVAANRGQQVPYIAHVHATEIDRCGASGDPAIIAIEKAGLHAADQVIAVSQYTKQVVHKHYGIPLSKISVVHNGIPLHETPTRYDLSELKKHHKLVLFMGRVTMQKGPDYYVNLAKAVTDRDPSVRFLLVGSGDMENRCIEQAAQLGLTGKMLFSSFLRGKDNVNRAYQLADLFVMPSVSEPFGLVALEAIQNGTPVLASKQSGVIEVAPHLVQADFWDIDGMRDAVLQLLHDPEYAARTTRATQEQLPQLGWDSAARRIQKVYREVIQSVQPLRPTFLSPTV